MISVVSFYLLKCQLLLEPVNAFEWEPNASVKGLQVHTDNVFIMQNPWKSDSNSNFEFFWPFEIIKKFIT